MTDPWTALMWGGLALVAVTGAVLGIATWLGHGTIPPLGDLTWEDDADACDCEACTGAPTELPDALVVERFLETTKEARP